MEFDILELLDFKVGGQPTPMDFILNSLDEVLTFYPFSDKTKQSLQEKALYFAFLLLTDNKASVSFTVAEIAAASIYMAIKMLEKKNKN